MGEDGNIPPRGGWKRRALIALAIFAALLLIFHRPLLQALVKRIAVYFAGKENLKIEFSLEGNVLTSLTVRNFHAVSVGPSDVESIDADFARVDYNLWRFLRHGPTDSFRNVEVRSARFVMNPAGTALKVRPPRPDRKIRLPGIFPAERIRLADVDLIVRNKPHDFVMRDVDADLSPRGPGELRIGALQLPTAPAWPNISATPTYVNRTLVAENVRLNEEERIKSLTIDASKVRSGILATTLEMEMGAGKLSGTLAMKETRSSLDTDMNLKAENVAMEALSKYLGLPEAAGRGLFERLTVDMKGVMNRPQTWNGTAGAQLKDYHGQLINFAQANMQVTARDGKATIEAGDLKQGENEFHFRGWAELPPDIKEVGRAPASLELTGSAIDLQALTAGAAQPLSGSAQIKGRIDIEKGVLRADLDGSAESIGFADGKIGKVSVSIKANRTMAGPNEKKTWFADLRTEMLVSASDIVYRGQAVDTVQASITGVNDLLTIDRALVRRKENELSVRSRYRLPEDFGKWPQRPEQAEISLKATELADFWISDARDKLSGPLQVDGQIEWRDGKADGVLSIFGAEVSVRGLVFKNVSGQWSIARDVLYVNDFTASLNEKDFVAAHGVVDLSPPHRYSGKIAANIADLATLQPLLEAGGNENELSGALTMNWEGSGDARISKSSGYLKVLLENGRYGDMQAVQAHVYTNYSPEGLDVPIIFLRNERMYFQANGTARGETLEISNIQLDQQEARYASGYVSIPFIWKNIGTDESVCPPDGKVVATFQSENIDIKKVFEDVGAKPLASGVLNVNLDAEGTIADLDARLDVHVRDLRSETLTKLEPASLELTALAQNDQLSINGKLQQAKIQPLELTANMPFDIPKIARARQVPDDTPITAKLHLPRSSVNSIRQFVSDIDTLDGDLALDVNVGGTFGQPALSGAGDITINLGRFHNPTLPTVTNFKARINFAENAFTLQQFGGELAGGKFTMGGRVTFPKLTQADLDLQFKADAVLVARNDDLTARADADLKIQGQFLSATVTGNAALTNSQFLKNIDLIPIGLPGRPAPQPLGARPEISFLDPPLRDWKFDLAVKTKDPFLIRGNLANGGAVGELHVTGTGLHPLLDGTVRMENVEATLPFSRLQVAYGILTFDPSDSFNPRIELHGTSVVRDYIIHVYVYGTSLEPEAIFSSEPPLPQEEVISLLATGTTREELVGSNNVLASRASMLLVQQLYRKIFKKGQATQSNSIFDRLDVDFGTVDPRTGQQQATARLRINDQFVVVGDLGVGGDYRGMLKYLIRFR